MKFSETRLMTDTYHMPSGGYTKESIEWARDHMIVGGWYYIFDNNPYMFEDGKPAGVREEKLLYLTDHLAVFTHYCTATMTDLCEYFADNESHPIGNRAHSYTGKRG